mgnify:CR=1 FL=1
MMMMMMTIVVVGVDVDVDSFAADGADGDAGCCCCDSGVSLLWFLMTLSRERSLVVSIFDVKSCLFSFRFDSVCC